MIWAIIITAVVTFIATVGIISIMQAGHEADKRSAYLYGAHDKARRIYDIAYNIELTDKEKRYRIEKIILEETYYDRPQSDSN